MKNFKDFLKEDKGLDMLINSLIGMKFKTAELLDSGYIKVQGVDVKKAVIKLKGTAKIISSDDTSKELIFDIID